MTGKYLGYQTPNSSEFYPDTLNFGSIIKKNVLSYNQFRATFGDQQAARKVYLRPTKYMTGTT